MNRTEQWAKRQGFTPQQLRAMGLDPRSIVARNKRTVAILKEMGPKPSTEGAALLRHLQHGLAAR